MNREIKFRMWDKDIKEMHEINLMDFKGEEVVDENGDIHSFEDIELMQFIGLYDKNKVPIYEGDIVELIMHEEIGVVEWDNEDAMFEINYGDWITHFDNLYGREVEVIGNIYENSNLLGE